VANDGQAASALKREIDITQSRHIAFSFSKRYETADLGAL
jgi:hypothetical protein